jgi:MFS transporter, MHS family, shikimate and dehydroshikimate transport protein
MAAEQGWQGASDSLPDPTTQRARVIAASFIGTTIEWYDFFLYGTAAALVFSKLFFPHVSSLVGTLSAFATFAVGFLARPLGGMVFGHFGDRIGRKSMLIISLSVMGLATFCIGLLPGFATIGIWAPAILVVLRILQGFGVGGEWGGAVLMAVEHSKPGKRGLSGSWPQMGVPAGLLLSTGMFTLFSQLPGDQFLAWGWRVPFLASILLVAVGLFIRLRVLESPAFSQVKESGTQVKQPLIDAVRSYPRGVLVAMGMRIAENGTFYVLTVFVLSYITQQLKLARGVGLTGVLIASALGFASIPLWGALSDRFGRRPVYMAGALFSLVFAFPFFWLLDTRQPVLIWFAIVLGINIGHDLMYGPQGSYFAELFGTRVRYSGASLGSQLGAVISGGFSPLIATALLAASGVNAVAAYTAVMALITVIATYFAHETLHSEITEKELDQQGASALATEAQAS